MEIALSCAYPSLKQLVSAIVLQDFNLMRLQKQNVKVTIFSCVSRVDVYSVWDFLD